jgi:hypothetical protein
MLLKVGLYLVLLLTLGCQSNNLEDYHKKGRTLLLDLCKELHQVNSLEDLIEKSPKLKKKMRRLTVLMIEADHYHRDHPNEEIKEKGISFESDRLCYEMLRICEEIEGARNVLETIQDEMLDKLDVNDRKTKRG